MRQSMLRCTILKSNDVLFMQAACATYTDSVGGCEIGLIDNAQGSYCQSAVCTDADKSTCCKKAGGARAPIAQAWHLSKSQPSHPRKQQHRFPQAFVKRLLRSPNRHSIILENMFVYAFSDCIVVTEASSRNIMQKVSFTRSIHLLCPGMRCV